MDRLPLRRLATWGLTGMLGVSGAMARGQSDAVPPPTFYTPNVLAAPSRTLDSNFEPTAIGVSKLAPVAGKAYPGALLPGGAAGGAMGYGGALTPGIPSPVMPGGAGAAGGMGAAGLGLGGPTAPGAGGFPGAAPTSPLGGGSAFSTSDLAPELGGNLAAGADVPVVIGDLSPMFMIQQRPTFPGNGAGQQPIPPNPRYPSRIVPSVRGFKIADNQSPFPQDRVFVTFNFFENVSQDLLDAFEEPITGMQFYRYMFGFEKTFNQGKGSFGLRFPIDTLYAASREPRLNAGGNSTAVGNLTIFFKHILHQTRQGHLFSAGVAVNAPTGPNTLANANFIGGFNNTGIQPFFGYFFNFDRFFIQGFSAIDAVTNVRDVTMAYNDVGIYYYLYRNREYGGAITAILPAFEVHVNNPLNHRSEYSFFDPSGTPDVVNFTYGLHTELFRSSVLSFGMVTPVTNPKPFDYEVVVQLNVRFGARRAVLPIIPTIGG